MAGASLAAALAPKMRVLILETEDLPGYHATGRSAAFWTETYGGPAVQPLTSVSGPFLAAPPSAFSEQNFLSPRGALMVGQAEQLNLADGFMAAFAGSGVDLKRVTGADLSAGLPGIQPDWVVGIVEASNADIDVAALHQAYLRAARRADAHLALRAPVTRLTRGRTGWTIHAGNATYQAQRVVNAAGAWATPVARLAGARDIAIDPKLRTMVQVRLSRPVDPGLPLVIDLAGRFYFKPEGTHRVWISPHDEAPTPPCDAAPEKEAVAQAMDRFAEVVDWPIEAVERSWAGLRSFSPDRAPVFGEDPDCPGFYWCAGQGGAGIQTAPAISGLLSALILEEPAAPPYAAIDLAAYAPSRFG